MYLFTVTSPPRDGGFDSTIALHEYMHGVSNRLTGGPSNVFCLQTLESAGLSEVFRINFRVGVTRLQFTLQEKSLIMMQQIAQLEVMLLAKSQLPMVSADIPTPQT